MNDTQLNTNDTQIEKSEAIASKILRTLAVIGLISILSLVTWAIVQGVRSVPNNNLSAVIASLRGAFQSAPSESLIFKLDTNTVASGESANIAWTYEGAKQPELYSFSYTCGTDTMLSIMENTGWTTIACDTIFETKDTTIKILPTNNTARFADVELHVFSNELKDTTVITVVNTDVTALDIISKEATSTSETTSEENTTKVTEQVKEAPKAVSPVKTTPTYTPPKTVTKRTVPMYNGPADLVVSIEHTGVLAEVDDEDTFFPISPIPTDKVAAVQFTVTNKGGDTSQSWIFKAELPIEGDKTYSYTSPKQAPILSGMQVEYTLSFDELLEAERGTIRIKIVPNDSHDDSSNNQDSVSIKIDKEN
jgi:hypothetical protein